MRKVQTYKTLAGAMRALDNGGRFYNLFTTAGDDVVTAAELRRAAGVFGRGHDAALFFALATAGLEPAARDRLVQAMDREARSLLRAHAPQWVTPSQFAQDGRPGRTYVVEGRVRRFTDETVTGMMLVPIMAGSTMTMMMLPSAQHFTVLELDGPQRGRECLVLTPQQVVPFRSGGRVRFAGVAKEAQVGVGIAKEKRVRLEARFYGDAS